MGDSIKALQEKIVAYRDARDWKQFHNPKDLALSLSLEASELLELFQWLSSDEAVTQNYWKYSNGLGRIYQLILKLIRLKRNWQMY